MKKKATYSVYQWKFWTEYFIQMRPYLLFLSGVAGLTGIAISKTPETPVWKCWLAFVPFFLGYGFGQALTDCFQTDTDKISAPYRPLSKGTISIRSVLIVSISGLLVSGSLFYFLNFSAFWLSLIVVTGLATYSYIKRNFWFGGPFYNAWIVALLPIIGYFACGGIYVKYNIQLLPYIVVTFFSYANFVIIGYLKDIQADRITGYKTFPVMFGWDKTIWVGDVFTTILLVVFWSRIECHVLPVLFGIGGSIVIISGQYLAHIVNQKDEQGAIVPILSTVRGFILLHLAIILQFQPTWWLYALIFYAVFEFTLYNRSSRYQV